MNKSIELEKKFKEQAAIAGLLVEKPKTIVSNHPVEDRNGKIKKTKTLPDCFVIDPLSQNSMHIEITNGSGRTDHKAAQKRVVEAAGVENYTVITGNQLKELCERQTPVEKRLFLLTIFGWLNLL